MKLTVFVLLSMSLVAQTLNVTPIPPSSLSFFSYSPVTQPTAPVGSQFLLTFPNQASGSQLTPSNCSTYAALQYNHYTFSGGTWTGPVTGPVFGYFTTFDSNPVAIHGWGGIQGNIGFSGVLGGNSNTSTQNFIQSFYYSSDNCYEYGPEVGFYKLLITPGSTFEESTVYFYYGLNVNCFNVAGLGSCRDKGTGASLQYNVTTQALTVPPLNSAGNTNFIYKAYLPNPTTFRVQVVDPFNNSVVYTQDLAVSSFFTSTANSLFTNGLSGFVTATQQRNSVLGGITDSMSNPLKLTVFGLAQLMMMAAPPPAIGRQALNGWCQQGGVTVYAPSVSGGSPSSRAFQRSYPGCTVDVYLAGTTTHATIYSTSSGTALSNPFTAPTTGALAGAWQFFADNGVYDVKMSGGGIPAPFTISNFELFDFSTWVPVDFFVTHAIGVYGAGGSTFRQGFTGASGLASDTIWTFPQTDSAGCWESNGSLQLSIIPCGVAGPNQSVQYNNGGVTGGDANFLWDKTQQQVTVTGIANTRALLVANGYTQSAGYVSADNSWQGFNTDTDGALLRGVNIAPRTAGDAGGYLNIAPLLYGNTPLPLNGLSGFGVHTALIWVSGTNPATPDTTYGINTNLYFNAAGGFDTGNTFWNSVQAPVGGMFANSFTALGYIQTGHHTGPPPVTGTGLGSDTFHQGAQYYDDILGPQVYNGSAWVSFGGGGGGGSPGGPTASVQFNGGGTFAGSANFFWSNPSQQLNVIAAATGNAGIINQIGFMQSENGFLAQQLSAPATRLAFNVIQAPSGGMLARSFTAGPRDGSNFGGYIQAGNGSGVPTPMPGDTFNAGALYWDTGAAAMQVFNGSAWVSLATGGATSPGAPTTSVQFNSSGSFAGSANLTYASQLLNSVAVDAAHAGMSVSVGFIQAATGFLTSGGTSASPLQFNSMQTPEGGMEALSFTAGRNGNGFGGYMQTGNGSGVPTVVPGDSFHAGALYYDTAAVCEELYNGSTWSCLGSGGGGGTPAAPTTSVQFNNGGSFGGNANFTWNNSTFILKLSGTSTDTVNVGEHFINSLAGGVAGKTIWALATSSGTLAVMRLSNGTGSGGYDGNGAQIYATASNGQITATQFTGGATGSAFTFGNLNNNFLVDGNGNISFQGVANAAGASGGFNVTGDISGNSIQTIGGFNAGSGSSGFGRYAINNATVIDNGKNFVGSSVTVGTGASLDATGASTIGLSKVNLYDGHLTSAKGMAAMYYSTSTSGNTGSIGTTQITYAGSTPPAGLYRVSGALSCIYGGSGSPNGNLNFTLGAVTDGNFYQVNVGATTLNCSTGPAILSFSYSVFTNGATSTGCNGICFGTSASGFTNDTYRVDMILERLQ